MTSYIISFILQAFQLPYNEDLLRLICENSSSYMNSVKPIFREEIGAPETSVRISKISEKRNFFVIYLRPTKF